MVPEDFILVVKAETKLDAWTYLQTYSNQLQPNSVHNITLTFLCYNAKIDETRLQPGLFLV